MRTVLTAAAAAALIASLASPAVAAPAATSPAEAASAPTSNAAGTGTSETKTNERNGSFDLQAHRGGRGEWTEESLAAFANSLALGVTTLELDTHLTSDGKIIVWHDDTIQADKCQDTAPATPGDAGFPYVGDRVAELSLAQIKTLDCGFTQLKGFPEQDVVEGNRIAELKDVFGLVRDANAKKVRFNIETKVEDGKSGGAGMVALTKAVVAEIQASGMAERSTVQSFDWSSLNLTKKIAPELPLVALSSGDAWLEVGRPGASPNLGGIDIDSYGGSLAQAAAAQGYNAISPAFRSVTPGMITEAHGLGLPVIPWTVNTTADINRLMDLGVDGIISDYPTRLRTVMEERGTKLPKAYSPKL
ncbi:glycerophosphodiester phosphodiesterase family protein [Arthrobacter sp. AL08]|uniref:glycerophosphodiester phosphodiesterase family protein n=1 Tax=unclassified Arthrobacter TaxID=235627 RepID=UPI00249B667B|nr:MULTISPECIES: glycerophosphodiester phosphodiesterase family protein [unclassified Arthrobacter]MDI3242214.1 glycerophosphodiester phosphodiesterase family protein [Arthrobacter sp. AL05]MDI3278180.1 glycerophosphodiester phosphodiesterase family protein [Arthrobacter sp. AL08]